MTPTEVQVADLIKAGKTSKEIAGVLNISARSVNFHRVNIRRKLHIHGSKTNLRTFLLSLT
ncbi:MAG: helix-turn-helix transcriptional regulator [Desulfobacteraceae bacterium]|nr:helix-turn-helix transcriptional regulator [Desulfobacteraceae bacterium]